MQVTSPRYDADFWNLEGLAPTEVLKGKGKVEILAVRGGLESVKRVRVLYDPNEHKESILLLRPDWDVIDEVRPDSPTARTVLDFRSTDSSSNTNLNILDIATFEGAVYLLNKRLNSIHQVIMGNGRLQPARSWSIDVDYIQDQSKLEVSSHNGQLMAFIGPCRNGVFLIVRLGTSVEMKVLDIKLPQGLAVPGKDLSFCVDEVSYTLIVADTMQHRIIEVDCETGAAKIICGTGERGETKKETIATNAKLDLPRSVAVYRPGKFVDIGKLESSSRTLLEFSEGERHPRIIFIADSGNYSVKKMVELKSVVADHLSLPREPLLYNFVGSGEKQKGDLQLPGNKAKKNLRNYQILKPFHVYVSELGDLFVICPSSRYLMLLRPATASADRSIHEVGSYEWIATS